MDKCLFCYKPLAEGEVDYHKSVSYTHLTLPTKRT